MGCMVGSPPPPDKRVRFTDMGHHQFPQTRWSFAHFRGLLPSSPVPRGDGPVAVLPRHERGDIDAVSTPPTGSQTSMTWAQSMDANYTDAIAVLHRGRIVHERCFGVMNPHQTHMAMSVTKSLLGTLGTMLVKQGCSIRVLR
jgi:CubicO group peptidase (beta-lactamase class C family)